MEDFAQSDAPRDSAPEEGGSPAGVESTARLLAAARGGDDAARNRLLARYLPRFQRWAHGRVPSSLRDLAETDDLVQVSLVKALNKMDGFEPRHEGAFLAYLRTILRNSVRDMLRQAKRRPQREGLDVDLPLNAPSPLENAIGGDVLEAYERALGALPERVREAVILRIELGFTYAEVAEAVECPSANAARMMVSRGLVQIAEDMHGDGHGAE
jgi:RNA polymerase sigma-70 factor (ECF subfamily)